MTMLPILPLLILGGGAVLYMASRKSSARVGPSEDSTCAVVTVTQARVDEKGQEMFAWAMRWQNKRDAPAIDALTDLCKTLFPDCTWPPHGDRTIVGTDGVVHKWSEFETQLAGKSVKDGDFRFGAMSAADASGLSQMVGPGFGGLV